MTIRKRLSRTNTRILLSALLSLLIISGIIIEIFESTYLDKMANYAKLEKRSVETVNILDSYDFSQDKLEDFRKEIENNGYQLYLEKDGTELYSDFTSEEKREMKHLKRYATDQKEADVFVWKNSTMIFKTYETAEGEYRAVALKNVESDNLTQQQERIIHWLIPVFMALGILAIGIIVGISRYFSSKLENQIIEPIEKLMEAANRMEEGDFTEPVEYEGEEEFEKLCQSFNMMQKSLIENINKAEEYEKAKTEMIAGISHDLRTPLTSVRGYLKGMKDGVANTPEKQAQYLDIAYQKACTMDVLLQKLFTYSKMETGNMPVYMEPTNLGEFLQNLVDEGQRDLKEKKTDVIFLKPDTQVYADIDREQIKRVIYNIVENSMKYRKGEHVLIQLHMLCREKEVILKIEDDGEGVPEEKLPYLFEQFYRGDETRNSKIDGDGLGLYIAKRIIEQHKGQIQASNNNGFCITITLPIVEENQE